MATPTIADLAGLDPVLARLAGGRAAFAQFFDAFVAEQKVTRPDLAWPSSHLDAIVMARLTGGAAAAAIDPATAAGAARLMLSALPDRAAAVDAMLAAIAEGLFDTQGESAADLRATLAGAALPAQGRQQERRETLQRAQLQAATNALESLPDPDRLLPALLLARKRLCRIECEGRVTGTGFLIGPSAVLTNWHVVRALPTPLGGAKLRAVFDYSQTTGYPAAGKSFFPAVDDWLIARSDVGPEEPAGAGEGWWMNPGVRQAWRAALATSLDFAVIRLDGAPGMQRGWYRLDEPADPSGNVFVLHHPLDYGRTLTAGHIHFSDDRNLGARLFHSATTEKGSSGGLVLDREGRPLALHYLGLGRSAFETPSPPIVPDEVVNVAVPLAPVAAALAPHGTAIEELQSLSLPKGCVGNGKPLFGRDQLATDLSRLLEGQARVLWVRPPADRNVRKPGKTFTTEVLEALLPPAGHLYVRITADQVRPGAREMAAMILGGLSARAADELPEPESTESAYDLTLIARMREIIQDRWPNALIWIVIDDLDVHDLTDSAGRGFLDKLYERIATIPQLRIVLIGLKTRLDAIPREQLIVHNIDALGPGELAEQFRQWLAVRGFRDRPLGDGAERLLANALASFAGSDAPLEALSGFVTAHFAPHIDPYMAEKP